jgi:hypothetical protein
MRKDLLDLGKACIDVLYDKEFGSSVLETAPIQGDKLVVLVDLIVD